MRRCSRFTRKNRAAGSAARRVSLLAIPVLAGALNSPVYPTYPRLRLHSDRLAGTRTPFHLPSRAEPFSSYVLLEIILAHFHRFGNSFFTEKRFLYPESAQKVCGPQRPVFPLADG